LHVWRDLTHTQELPRINAKTLRAHRPPKVSPRPLRKGRLLKIPNGADEGFPLWIGIVLIAIIAITLFMSGYLICKI
jgi:hypothetical protein